MVLAGTGTITFEDGVRTAEAGDSFYFPGRMPHGFRVPEGRLPVLLINVEAAAGTTLQPSLAGELPRRLRAVEWPSARSDSGA